MSRAKKTFSEDEAEAIRWSFAVNDRVRLLIELLIPLPCLDYQIAAGSCSVFECPSIDGEDPLCQTRRLLAEQAALAIQMNKYDPLHPGYMRLPETVRDLIAKAHRLSSEGRPLPEPKLRKNEKDEDN